MGGRGEVPKLTSAAQTHILRGAVAKAARVARDLLALDAGTFLR